MQEQVTPFFTSLEMVQLGQHVSFNCHLFTSNTQCVESRELPHQADKRRERKVLPLTKSDCNKSAFFWMKISLLQLFCLLTPLAKLS